tara:strand:- start:80063 stop:80251 length:189 start_codon:yes stop_codon:yes gene_type:complete
MINTLRLLITVFVKITCCYAKPDVNLIARGNGSFIDRRLNLYYQRLNIKKTGLMARFLLALN